jgi:hypothetical protein
MSMLEQYESVVGASALEELRLIARHLENKRIITVNSTAVGGGVAEILNRMVPLCGELGVTIRWDVIKGGEDFFAVTKRIHNALHDKAEQFTTHDRDVFRATTESNLSSTDPTPTSSSSTIRSRWAWSRRAAAGCRVGAAISTYRSRRRTCGRFSPNTSTATTPRSSRPRNSDVIWPCRRC